jgi:hypothetical protein
MSDYGPLAAALAKAQAAFPPISRDREVTVQMKTGGSYKFKYAPLDSLLSAVRVPLAANGLAIVQLLDEDVLVTSLLHESGAILSGRTPIPATEGVQAYGSAITYLRRYSIQALLGIAAEEDDDGNQAAGNRATFSARQQATTPAHVSIPQPAQITGTVSYGTSNQSDGNLRETPDGWALGFNLTTGPKAWVRVLVEGDLALALAGMSGALRPGLGLRIHGTVEKVEDQVKDRVVRYERITAERITADEWELPRPQAPSVALFDESELDAALERLP